MPTHGALCTTSRSGCPTSVGRRGTVRLAAGGAGIHAVQNWSNGRSWRLGPVYLVLEQSPALTADRHERRRPGLNHLAFHVEDAAAVEELAAGASRHGWRL
ncbi:hypothetical protein ACFSNO_25605, partial [Streptomyces cirratus]